MKLTVFAAETSDRCIATAPTTAWRPCMMERSGDAKRVLSGVAEGIQALVY